MSESGGRPFSTLRALIFSFPLSTIMRLQNDNFLVPHLFAIRCIADATLPGHTIAKIGAIDRCECRRLISLMSPFG
jgi:hypothetical protein